MSEHRVEYTVWVYVDADNPHDALAKANERLGVGDYDDASMNLMFDADGEEIDLTK